MSDVFSTVVPGVGFVTIPPGAGLNADTALPWLIDVDVFEQAVANTNWDSVAAGAAYLMNGIKYSSAAQNDEIGFDVVLAKGTWTIELLFAKSANFGIYSVQLNSVEKGTIDSYNGSATYNHLESVSGVAVAQTAKYRLTLKMATKNASSSNYQAALSHIQLRRTA